MRFQPMNQVEAEQLAADMNATGKCNAWAEPYRSAFDSAMWVVMYWGQHADEPQRCGNRDYATRQLRILERVTQ